MNQRVRLNDEGDILYVAIREGTIAKTLTFGDHRLVDVDEDGRLIGAEFIGLAEGIDLRGLPEQARLRDALLSPDLRDFVVRYEHPSGFPRTTSQGNSGSTVPTHLPFNFQERQPVKTQGPAALAKFE